MTASAAADPRAFAIVLFVALVTICAWLRFNWDDSRVGFCRPIQRRAIERREATDQAYQQSVVDRQSGRG